MARAGEGKGAAVGAAQGEEGQGSEGAGEGEAGGVRAIDREGGKEAAGYRGPENRGTWPMTIFIHDGLSQGLQFLEEMLMPIEYVLDMSVRET